MRTLTLRQWAIQNWMLNNWMLNLVRGERRYSVSGAFAFEMSYSTKPDLAAMRKAICETDAEFPWHDDIHPGAGEFESIFYLSDGDVIVHNLNRPLKLVWFNIHPKWDNLRKGQVYAYEHYLIKLAKELAKRFSESVYGVRSVIEVRAGTSFRTR